MNENNINHFDHILNNHKPARHHASHKSKWLVFDFVLIAIIIFIAVLTYKWYLITSNQPQNSNEKQNSQTVPTSTISPTTIEKDFIVCTQDVKQCDDGSYVVRIAPRCEFEKCAPITYCGGIQGKVCASGYTCKYPKKDHPDISGTCIKN